MLPSNAKIGVTVASDNRYGDISMTFDGRQSMILPVGRSLTVFFFFFEWEGKNEKKGKHVLILFFYFSSGSNIKTSS